MLGVQQWAEVRRLVLVEGRSQREVARLTGLARDTVARAVASETPPRYSRAPAGSKLDPFRDWICGQLREEPTIQAQRLRELAAELGYAGGRTIFDDYVREVRPRFLVRRTFQRTVYRPGELVQCDLWEPREPVPVGHGQTRRGWVVTAELCWSRVIAGALIFSKEAPDVLWGIGRCLGRIGALPERLVWDREGAIAPGGRPTDEFAAFCGQLGVGWIILAAGDAQAKGALERSHRFMRSNFLPGRRFANPADPRFAGRRVEVRVSQTEVTAGVLDTGELACRHRRVFAGGLTITDPAHQSELERQRARRHRRDEVEVEIRPLSRYDALIGA